MRTRLDPVAVAPRRAASRSSKCRRDRRCCRRSWPRCTGRIRSARPAISRETVRSTFERTPGVVDVDWYVEIAAAEDGTSTWTARRPPRPACRAAHVASVVRMAGAGAPAGLLHDAGRARGRADRAAAAARLRGSLDARRERCASADGRAVAARRADARRCSATEEPSIYHKNLLPVTYVTGDVAGGAESPVYAILQMNRALLVDALPEGYGFEIFNAQQPFDSSKYAMKWDGEWHITYEVFRDLGIAFAAVLS